MYFDEADVVRRAFGAYHETVGDTGDVPANDSGLVAHDGRDYVVLRNIHGVLAIYAVSPDGGVTELDEDEWPDTLLVAP